METIDLIYLVIEPVFILANILQKIFSPETMTVLNLNWLVFLGHPTQIKSK